MSRAFSETQEYVSLYNRLRRVLGRHEFGTRIDLPQIVFCGNQSSGKSSLVEGISRVPLPRKSGTATRARMEIRLLQDLSEDGEWKCVVKLLVKGREIPFGNPIDDPQLVELHVKRAQKALLNPNQDYNHFLYRAFDDTSDEDNFADDAVLLEITGPDCPNLTIIDLPGLINLNPTTANKDFKELISKMNENAIKDPNTIIVAVCSALEDKDMNGIFELARKYDPFGNRTLVVLTKLDRVEPANQQNTLRMAESLLPPNIKKSKLGYYAVRNPTQDELERHIGHDDARRIEDEFFESNGWLSELRAENRCGINNLKTKLSELLVEALKPQIDIIRDDCQTIVAEIEGKLADIPAEVFSGGEDLRLKVSPLISDLANRIRSAVNTTGEKKGLFHEVFKGFRQFEKELFNVRPIFQSANGHFLSVTLEGKQRISEDYKSLREGNQPTDSSDEPRSLAISRIPPWTYKTVQETIEDERGLTLVSYDVVDAVKKIVRIHQKEWKNPTRKCVNSVHDVFSRYVIKTANEVFSGAYVVVADNVRDILKGSLESERVAMEKLALDILYSTEVPEEFEQAAFTMREAEFVAGLDVYYNVAKTKSSGEVLTKLSSKIVSSIGEITQALDSSAIKELLGPAGQIISLWGSFINALDPAVGGSGPYSRITDMVQILKGKLATIFDDEDENSEVVLDEDIPNLVHPLLNMILAKVSSTKPEQLRSDAAQYLAKLIDTNDEGGQNQSEVEPRYNVQDDPMVGSENRVYRTMSGALSYYTISHFRFLDNITRSIYIIMLSGYVKKLQEILRNELGLNGTYNEITPDDWDEMARGDPKVAMERSELQSQRDELKDIIADAERIRRSRRIDEDF